MAVLAEQPASEESFRFADQILSCANLDAAREKYGGVVAQALKNGPAEGLFRAHWAKGTQFHNSLRGLLARAAAACGTGGASASELTLSMARESDGQFWGFTVDDCLRVLVVLKGSPAHKAGLEKGVTVISCSNKGGTPRPCVKKNDVYGHPWDTELDVTVSRAAKPERRADAAAKEKQQAQGSGWNLGSKEQAEAKPAAPAAAKFGRGWKVGKSTKGKGLKDSTWSCPGCGWLLRFISEWRCKRCLTLQPGAIAADPALLQKIKEQIPSFASALGVDQEDLLCCHPGDVQVLMEGDLVGSKMVGSSLKATAHRLLSILPYRSQDATCVAAIAEYSKKYAIPQRLEIGLRTLDSQGVRKVLGQAGATLGMGEEQGLLTLALQEQGRMKQQIAADSHGGGLGFPWWLQGTTQAQEEEKKMAEDERLEMDIEYQEEKKRRLAEYQSEEARKKREAEAKQAEIERELSWVFSGTGHNWRGGQQPQGAAPAPARPAGAPQRPGPERGRSRSRERRERSRDRGRGGGGGRPRSSRTRSRSRERRRRSRSRSRDRRDRRGRR